MAVCACCGSTIVFGGKKYGEYRFCDDKCQQKSALLMVTGLVPKGVCACCGTRIVFGGKKYGEYRFCNDKCQQKGALLIATGLVPKGVVDKYVHEVHSGFCPECHGRGPVDVHTSYRVWSVLIVTNWSSRPQICCQSCGTKNKIGYALFSLVLGWWGVPLGVLMTPIQVIRNVVGLFPSLDPLKPSPQLEKMIKLHLADQLMKSNKHG